MNIQIKVFVKGLPSTAGSGAPPCDDKVLCVPKQRGRWQSREQLVRSRNQFKENKSELLN